MKQTKEYPATHSMSTAWYVADEDGNVGIMDFNENGPVPWHTEESSVEELVFGYEKDYEKKEYLLVSLSNEQIDDLLTNPHSPEEEENWWDCVIQITAHQKLKKMKSTRFLKHLLSEKCLTKKSFCEYSRNKIFGWMINGMGKKLYIPKVSILFHITSSISRIGVSIFQSV